MAVGACVGPIEHVITGPLPTQVTVRLEASRDSAPLLASNATSGDTVRCPLRIIDGRVVRQVADTVVLERVSLVVPMPRDGPPRTTSGCFSGERVQVIVPPGAVTSRLEPPGITRQTLGSAILIAGFVAGVGLVILGVGWLLSLTGA